LALVPIDHCEHHAALDQFGLEISGGASSNRSIANFEPRLSPLTFGSIVRRKRSSNGLIHHREPGTISSSFAAAATDKNAIALEAEG
jgi:hypothetical protein